MATTAREPEERQIPVTITIDAQRKIHVSPDPFHLSKGRNQEVSWVNPDGHYFNVDFGADSPFYESQFSSDYPCSGLVRRSLLGDPGKVYKYTVRVDGVELDPGGIIRT